MAITILPNQALGTNSSPNSGGYDAFYLPSMRGDNFWLQGEAGLMGSDTNLCPTSGWTLGAGFSMAGNVVTYAGNGSITSATSPTLNLAVGGLYQLYIDVTVTNADGAIINQGFNMSVNGIYIPLPNGGTGSPYGYNKSFSLMQYFCPSSIISNNIVITTNYPGIEFTCAISLIQMSAPVITAFNLEGEPLALITPNFIHYFTAPDYDYNPSGGASCLFDIQFNLDALPDGCYYVTITDNYGFVNNGFFADGSSDWVLGTGWAVADGEACYFWSGDADGSATLLTYIPVIANMTYTINYALSGKSDLNYPAATIYFNDGSNQAFAMDTDGIGSFTFTVPADASGAASLSFNVNGYGGPVCLSKIYASLPSGFTSNLISFQTDFPDYQTHLFTASNNDGAFGFDYSQGLTHTIRLWSKYKYKTYKQNVDEYNFSDNSNVLMTSYVEKVYEVTIGDAPEFVHDTLSMMVITDNFAIDETPFIQDGSYAVKGRQSTELSASTFDVKPVVGIGKNWNISG